MPIERAQASGLADKLAEVGGLVKELLDASPDLLFTIREISKSLQATTGKLQDGYLVSMAIGILISVEDVAVEKRAGKLLVGSK